MAKESRSIDKGAAIRLVSRESPLLVRESLFASSSSGPLLDLIKLREKSKANTHRKQLTEIDGEHRKKAELYNLSSLLVLIFNKIYSLYKMKL